MTDGSSTSAEQLLTTLVQSMAQLTQRVDTLTDQVGHLTEGLTEIKLITQQQATTADKQADSIKALSESVASLVSRLDK